MKSASVDATQTQQWYQKNSCCPKGDQQSGAVFDRSGKFRYLLWRQWDGSKPNLCFVMLNPSTANEAKNDPTITRCINFARRWNFGGLRVVNAFAYRATDSRKLYRVRDPVGPLNDEIVSTTAADCDTIVLAWGNHGRLLERDKAMVSLLSEVHARLWCLGQTKSAQPRHPLYVANAAQLMPFLQ